MNIALTPHLEDVVRHQVASGRYASASELFRELLREFLRKNEEEEAIRLKQLIQAGFDSGKAEPMENMKDIIAEAKSEYV